MDIVYIRGLRIETTIGIHDWEKKIRRPVILDIEMASDVRRAASTDHIEDALDYDAVAKRLTEVISSNRFELVETLAEHCATILRDELGVPWVRLGINKIGAIGEGIDVGVLIERGEKPI